MRKLFFLLPLAIVSCWKESKPIEIVRPVVTTDVQSLKDYQREYIGILESEESTVLAFGVGGQVIDIAVSSGSVVGRGDLIARLDDADYKLKVKAEEATYLTNQAALKRAEILTERGALSKQDYEMAQARYEASKARYNFAQSELRNTILRAPFSGSIETTLVDDYQEVTAGQAICKLINPNQLYVEFTIPQNDIALIKPLQKFTITIDNTENQIFTAKLDEIVDASVDGAGIPISLTINDPNFNPNKLGIKAGFGCKVRVEVDDSLTTNDYCVVPLSAIWAKSTDSKNNYVWIYNPKTSQVESKRVETSGLIGSSNVIIKKGINRGEKVVTAGVHQLRDNQEVKLLPKK